jgi:glycosyltransferase involved in cell wall biosynthesis
LPMESVWSHMESLKFLMVSTHYPPAHLGGDARFVEYLSNELVRAGHEVHVLHSPYAFSLQRGFMPDLDEVTPGGVHRHVHLSSFRRVDPVLGLALGRGPGSVRRFRELVARLKPEVIHWHNTKGFIGRPVASPSGLSLYTAHDFYAVCPRSSLLRPGQKLCQDPFLCQSCLLRWRKPPQLWRVLNMRAMRPPEGFTVISPSEFMARRLSRDGIRSGHILRNFAPDRGVISSGSGGSRVVYIGILERFKGLMTLLEAFDRSRDAQGFELSVFGEGSLRAALEGRTRSLGLEGRVRIHGHVHLDEVKDTLRETAAVIVPSESYENAPLAALEALSMGIPVIGSDIGGLPEIVRPENGSSLFPPGDAVRLAEEIVGLWNSRGSLGERSKKARAAYEASYSPEAHLRSYMGILRGQTT